MPETIRKPQVSLGGDWVLERGEGERWGRAREGSAGGGGEAGASTLIVERATDLYTFIHEVLSLPRGDRRATLLNRATETFLRDVLSLVGRAA